AGVRVGLREAGLVEGRDYVATVRNAQGDMATVNSLIDAAITERSDLLITFSTPTLQAALQRARRVPIVFNYLASPIAAGAGPRRPTRTPCRRRGLLSGPPPARPAPAAPAGVSPRPAAAPRSACGRR